MFLVSDIEAFWTVSLYKVGYILVTDFFSPAEEKEGQYTPEKKISRIYSDYGYGKTLREIWRWNDNLLQSIDHYSSGSVSWVEEFTYNDNNQIVRVEDFLNGETMEYEYDGSNISKAIYYDEGSMEYELSFKYTDNKITDTNNI